MLPEELGTDLCSLNAGTDRLAFSVEVEVDPEGQVLRSWVGRTVMRSSYKMDYKTAQGIIEAGRTGAADPALADAASLYGHEWADLCSDVRDLHSLAQRRRHARKARGAVIMESGDLYFEFDERGYPVDVALIPQEEANHLVEEMMLLANSVAVEQMTRTPEGLGLLVRNPPPSQQQLKKFAEAGQLLGVAGVETPEDVSRAIASMHEANPEMGKVLFRVTMPLQRASYFHSSEFPLAEWAHYALAINKYTHFTSPIRRFADMTVHRVLAQLEDAERAAAAAADAAAEAPSVIVPPSKKGAPRK
jgi:VacB/RNase II family 3'-5' exoribonuclease